MTCRCGHPRRLHRHLRAGTECALCWCPAFRTSLPWTRATSFPPKKHAGVIPPERPGRG